MLNIKSLFYVKLRISAGMIENFKTRNIALIPTPFNLEALRCLKM